MASDDSAQQHRPQYLKHRGVVYDVGLNFNGDGFSVEPFDSKLVEYDMRAIAHELNANAVRIEGEDLERLVVASQVASSLGLTVFFNPWKMHAAAEETSCYIQEAARAAEELRLAGVDIILLVGCEYSIFSKGVFPGETFNERITWLGTQFGGKMSHANIPNAIREKEETLNEVLRTLVSAARAHFKGPVTYSSGTWELVDWSIFEIVGIDYYRRGETAEEYIGGLECFRSEKPLAVMEFGCCAYEGAAARGDGGFVLLQGTNPDGTGKFPGNVQPTRSEKEQADYIRTQLGLLRDARVRSVFVFIFSFPAMKIGDGGKDFDMMGFSLVKTFPDDDVRSKKMPPWAPKEAYHAVADFYRQDKERASSSTTT